jgi:hypothetical protein
MSCKRKVLTKMTYPTVRTEPVEVRNIYSRLCFDYTQHERQSCHFRNSWCLMQPGIADSSPNSLFTPQSWGNCSGEAFPRLLAHIYTTAKIQSLIWATTGGRPYGPKLGRKCIAPYVIPIIVLHGDETNTNIADPLKNVILNPPLADEESLPTGVTLQINKENKTSSPLREHETLRYTQGDRNKSFFYFMMLQCKHSEKSFPED